MIGGDYTMDLLVQPVVLRGLVWGSPGRPGGAKRREERLDELGRELREKLPGLQVPDPVVIDGDQDLPLLRTVATRSDVLLVIRAELLSVRWAAPALASVEAPLILFRSPNFPGAVMADLYGYLRPEGCDVFLALNFEQIRRRCHIIGARKRLREIRVLLIGQGFPSWSQVANPTDPVTVRNRLGVEVVELPVEALFDRFPQVPRDDAEKLAQEWIEGAAGINEEGRRDIVEVAQVHIALEQLLAEHQAGAITVDCRMWDEQNMERFGRFYSPCMPLTVFRQKGVPAACEADVNALLSMMILGFLAEKPAFMGNLGGLDPEEGTVDVGHCAATVNMDGFDAEAEPYELMDYHHRGSGLASFSRMREGETATIARLEKDLDRISLAAGPILDTSMPPGCINRLKVQIGNIPDFVRRCWTGDHYAAVYGDQRERVWELCEMLGMEVLEPGRPYR